MTMTAEVHEAILPVQRRRAEWGYGLACVLLALVAASLVMRVWQLGNLPGLNGDEAWSGVQAMRAVRGEPFAWRTPTGNPANPFFMAPLVALHIALAPSFALLRSIAVVSGIAALVVNYWLCRRAFDTRTALVSTVLLAILPINVAYSRFAWDASQSLLATVLVLYLPLIYLLRTDREQRLPVAAMGALALALLVHPTNVFAAPLIVIPIGYVWRGQVLDRLRGTAVSARPGSLVALMLASAFLAYVVWMLLAGLVTRLHGPVEFGEFVQNYLRLLSGATVYEYIAGVEYASGELAAFAWLPATCKLLFGAVVVVGAWGWLRRLGAGASDVDVCLLLGWIAMLLGFAVVAGPEAIAPHLERYGICLVAPGCLVLARGLCWWIEPARAHRAAIAWALTLCAWLFPVTFALGYFDFIERTGGLSHRAFRTAASEPKLAAFKAIVAQRPADEAIEIVASEWWLYWPLAYMALGEDHVRVSGLRQAIDPQAVQRPRSEPAATIWYVEFLGSVVEREVLQQLAQSQVEFERQVITDYAGNPLISLIKVGRESFREIIRAADLTSHEVDLVFNVDGLCESNVHRDVPGGYRMREYLSKRPDSRQNIFAVKSDNFESAFVGGLQPLHPREKQTGREIGTQSRGPRPPY